MVKTGIMYFFIWKFSSRAQLKKNIVIFEWKHRKCECEICDKLLLLTQPFTRHNTLLFLMIIQNNMYVLKILSQRDKNHVYLAQVSSKHILHCEIYVLFTNRNSQIWLNVTLSILDSLSNLRFSFPSKSFD